MTDDDPLAQVRSAWLRARQAFSQQLWPASAILAALALLAVLSNQPGTYVGDNRFEQYWAPGHRLLREAFIWDATRDIGRVREDFWPGSTGVIAILRGLGASPALAERLWHALLLTVGGTGVVAVVRLFRRRIEATHLLAGLFYAFSPYSATFLIPSSLYLPYALAPWLLVAFVHGVRREDPLRWAAVFALTVFAAGTDDPPGLAYALVPLLPTAIYLVHVDRVATWRRVLGWTSLAGVLSVGTAAAALAKIAVGSGAFAQRLAETESPATVSVASSWSETWRGMGLWLSYFREQGGLLRPQGAGYFTSAPVLLLSFLPGCAALWALARSRWRPRLLFAALMLLSIVIMVGSYPLDDPTPYGRVLLEGYRALPWLGGLRNTYKAGAGLAMGAAVLLAVAATGVPGRWLRRVPYPWLPTAACAALIAVISFPFWSGRLYAPSSRLENDVPGYWRQALAYLDNQDDGTRVLVLPGSTRTRYRWGWVGDDIFDALLRRAHAVPSGVPLSNPEAANLLQATAERASSDRYVAGTLAPIARRLGIGTIVIRNDLDWQQMRVPRPAVFDALRKDPDLRRVATFGPRGRNVRAEGDTSIAVFAEAVLPPVEVYAIEDAVLPERVQEAAPPTLVAGDGYAWSGLAARGVLGDRTPLRYTGRTSDAELGGLLRSGSPVTVSDTNRRRLTLLSGPRVLHSHTLTRGEDLDRETPSLFDPPGTQSVAWFPDATRITSSEPVALDGYQPWARPALAFDGDPRTSWLVGGYYPDPTGISLTVRLRRPTRVGEVELLAPTVFGRERRATEFVLRFSDGTSTTVELAEGRGIARFRPRVTSSIELTIDKVEGAGLAQVGVAEVVVPGLDLAERIQLPDDLFTRAEGVAGLGAALRRAPLAYQFDRAVGTGNADEEVTLRRRFRAVTTRTFTGIGSVRVGRATSDQALDALLGQSVGAFGSTRAGGELGNRGGLAVDGRLDTGWAAPARTGERLTLRFPERVVDHVDVVAAEGPGYSAVTEARVTVGGAAYDIALEPTADCSKPRGSADRLCVRRAFVAIPPTTAAGLTVDVTGVAARPGPFGPQAVQLIEVFYDFAGNREPDPAAPVEGCRSGALTIDGQPLPVRVEGTVAEVVSGRAVPVTTCEDRDLGPGWHEVGGDGQVLVDTLRLESAGAEVTPERSSPVPALVERVSPTHVRLRYRATGPTTVTHGQSFDEGWTASVNGGPPRVAGADDTLATWRVEETGAVVVDIRFAPARLFTGALGLTLASVLACAVLVVLGGRRRG